MSTERRMERRIVIHGCSGSGKSTLGRRLSTETGLPVIELDALFHQRDWVPADRSTFRHEVTVALDSAERLFGGWIVDGNYGSKLDDLVSSRAQVAIWFDFPRRVVMWRIIARSLRRAAFRQELWNGNRERWRNLTQWNPEANIIRWTWTQHHRYHEHLVDAEGAADGPELLRVQRQRDVDRVVSAFSC